MSRAFALGDPQAPFDKVLDVLARHDVLERNRIASDVTLVSIGDHFDYDFRDPVNAGAEGVEILRWLAAQPNTRILIGNHDISRVMELVSITDERFAAARAFARDVDAGSRSEDDFFSAFPDLPPSGVVGRDYASFSVAQRELVIELLLADRFELALVAELADGRTALVTHAGITTRELAMLGLSDERDPFVIAEALRALLASAIDRVRDDWQRGVATPLSLAPLHVPGAPGQEGGGLLYHRPTNPEHRPSSKAWELAPDRPRRFDPRTLPIGLTQIAGHNGHNKCLHELGTWSTPAARARKHGGIRTLRHDAGSVMYDQGLLAAAPNTADLILIDGELRRVPSEEVALLPLSRVF